MNADFYRAFEERYRGSRDLIKSRLQVYLPFVEILRSQHQDAVVIDLGCGRGEWLELLREHGISALGIDIDDQMLAACRERDLRVATADALTWLAGQADASCDVVSAFHLAEHLPFDILGQLVAHGLRVLRPCGLLILETPNPENIVVGTANFYLDPTHLRPLPPPLLAFLVEHEGFARTKIARLQESFELAAGREPTLFEVLGGASPDYAVIAQKQGDGDRLSSFDLLFERDYGLKTDTLAFRYEQAKQQVLANALDLGRQQQQQLQAYQVELQSCRVELQGYHAGLEASRAQLQALYASHSWRLTAPLRYLTTGLRVFAVAMPALARKTVRCLLRFMWRWMAGHAVLKTSLRVILGPCPRLETKLRSFVASCLYEPTATSIADTCHRNPAIALTPAARRVYADLHAAVEASKLEGAS